MDDAHVLQQGLLSQVAAARDYTEAGPKGVLGPGLKAAHAAARAAASSRRKRGNVEVDKGVIDRWRALTIAERTDQALLQSQGINSQQARALAMAGTGKIIRKRDYSSAYVVAAKRQLPAAMHAQIHRAARGSAGGVASRRARAGRRDESKAQKMARIAALRAQLKTLLEEVDKSSPTMAGLSVGNMSVSPPGVVGPPLPPGTKRRRVDKSAGDDAVLAAAFAEPVAKRAMLSLDDALLTAVFKQHVKPTDGNQTPYEDPAPLAPYLDAQRLVVGMDHELQTGNKSVEEARQQTSKVLAQNMGAYDNARAGGPEMRHVGGLDLDLGSGNARTAGMLGLDVYPYDHGTIIHDVNLGLPFPTGGGRSVRLCNSLDAIVGEDGDPMPLMREVQRFLGIDGRFEYIGPALGERVDWSKLPAMEVIAQQLTDPAEDDGHQTEALTAVRRPARLPVVYGADPRYLGYTESGPDDFALAQEAFGSVPKAQTAMANLVHKRLQVPVFKADRMQQIASGVVLSPEEADSQNDLMSAAEIERTAHEFLAECRVVGKEHSDPMPGGEVVESYIAPMDLNFSGGQYGPQVVKKGSWVISVHISDPDEWAGVLDGTYTGFSVGGWGERVAA